MAAVMAEEHKVIIDNSESPAAIRFPPVFNVAVSFIDRHVAEGRSDVIALRSAHGDVSYGQLAENVARCGNALKSLGIGRGERILMAVKDSPTFFYVFWGAIKAGFVPVVVNTLLKAPDYRHLIEDSACVGVIYSSELADEVIKAASTASPRPVHVLSTDAVATLMETAAESLVPAPTRSDEDCFWLYSSGSTGKPKGVVHVHRDMVITSVRYGIGTIGIEQKDTVFCVSKLFFSFGFGGGMTFPLWAGATIALSEELPSAEMAFKMIEKYRPTVYFCVPTLYGQQLHALETSSRDLSSIRVAASAGEALPAPIFHKWQERTGIAILDGIGSTEVLHVFVCNRHGDIKPGSSGRPVPGYEVKVVDEAGNPVGPGEIGILMVKGQSNARCYWNNPEKTAQTMCGEWLNTGDMYTYDEQGYYTNAGRGDDMLKVGAMWCSPVEIESKLLEHPKVREAAVVGRADADGLLKPAAYIVPKNAGDACEETVEELKKFCKSNLAGYKYPRWFTFVEQLPKTVTGKIQRFKLRQLDDA